jgi:hypothetical protein
MIEKTGEGQLPQNWLNLIGLAVTLIGQLPRIILLIKQIAGELNDDDPAIKQMRDVIGAVDHALNETKQEVPALDPSQHDGYRP